MKKDIVVVGAGMAGSYAAYIASKAGHRVTIYESINFTNWKTDPLRGRRCGEGIWQAKLEKAGISIEISKLPQWVESYTRCLALGRFDLQNASNVTDHPVNPYLFINRKSFQDYYIQKASELGAKFVFGDNITDIARLKESHKESVFLVACGSNWRLGQKSANKHDEYVLAFQYTMYVEKDIIKNKKTIYLSDDPLIRYFYVYPKFDTDTKTLEANVGVMYNTYKMVKPQDVLDNFIVNIMGIKKPFKTDTRRTFGKLIPVKPGETLAIANDILLLGDALPLADPVSGGGIGHALLSAFYSVKAVESADPEGSYKRLMEPMIANLKYEFLISKKVFPLDPDQKVEANNAIFKTVFEQSNSDSIFSLGKIASQVFDNK